MFIACVFHMVREGGMCDCCTCFPRQMFSHKVCVTKLGQEVETSVGLLMAVLAESCQTMLLWLPPVKLCEIVPSGERLSSESDQSDMEKSHCASTVLSVLKKKKKKMSFPFLF